MADSILISVLYRMFGCVLIAALFTQIYALVLPDILLALQSLPSTILVLVQKGQRFIQNWDKVIRDFKHYRPWRSTKGIIIISSKKHITELSEASELSQRAIYADMFGFKYTMKNLDHNEQKVARSRLYGRVLQVNGPVYLSTLHPFLQARLERSFATELMFGKSVDGWTSVPLAATIRKLSSGMMSLAFFGESISNNPVFASALLRYPQDMVSSMAAFQITPSFIAPLVHAIITKRGLAMRTLLDHLTAVIGPLRSRWDEPEDMKKLTILYRMTDLARDSGYWTPETLAQSLIGIWFAASHQPWMNLNFVLLELCIRPNYLGDLRAEIGHTTLLDYGNTLAIRRKALKSFNFSNGGPNVAVGNMACVSFYDLMHNEEYYPNATKFDGKCFVSIAETSGMRGTRSTDVSEHFPVWGYGSLACPGRFYASLVMKMVLVYLISDFDFRLENEKARRQFCWETFTMPYERTRVLFRKRAY